MAFNTKGKIFCAIFLIVIILCFSIFSCWYLMRHFAVYNRETRRLVNGHPQRSTATSGQVPTYQNHHKVPGIENKRKLVRILTEKLWSHCADNFNGTSKNELSTRFVASSLSTLFLVGMKDQFYQFHPKKVQIFNASNAKFYYSEYIASLLSSYALTKDTNFENLAFEAVYQNRNFYEFSSNTLEYWYLFKITNDSRFSQEVERHLSSSSLNSSKISEDTIQFLSTLIKLYALTNRTNELSIQLYKRTLDQLDNSGAFLRTKQNQTFFKDGPDYMNSSSCLLGAILSQGGELMLTSLQQTGKQLGNERAIQERARINRHWQLAEQITQTCAQLSQRYSGLLPERIYFNDNENQNQDNSNFKIRSELAESYFILWRLTHSEWYRQRAWSLTEAIYAYYMDIFSGKSRMEMMACNEQEIELISKVLKYLFMIFSDESESMIELDQWVFNGAGQPLPICSVEGGGEEKSLSYCIPKFKAI